MEALFPLSLLDDLMVSYVCIQSVLKEFIVEIVVAPVRIAAPILSLLGPLDMDDWTLIATGDCGVLAAIASHIAIVVGHCRQFFRRHLWVKFPTIKKAHWHMRYRSALLTASQSLSVSRLDSFFTEPLWQSLTFGSVSRRL